MHVQGGGGGTYTSAYMYTCTCSTPQAYVFNDIKTAFMHAAYTHDEVLFQDYDEDGAMAKYSDVMRGRYVCGMIVV